jgi:hypothetical protein
MWRFFVQKSLDAHPRVGMVQIIHEVLFLLGQLGIQVLLLGR